MKRGDILFYSSDGSFVSKLIVWRTGQPGNLDFVHVAINVGNGKQLEALNTGVVIDAYKAPEAVWSPSSCPPPIIGRAIGMVSKLVNSEYGWMDDVADALPPWWKLLILDRDAYSCSHLVANYLVALGMGDKLGMLMHQTFRVTPNDLARALTPMPYSTE